MDNAETWLQRAYYTVGTASAIASALWFLGRGLRRRLADIEARLDAVEATMVTQETFQKTITDLIDREADWKREHERWGEAVMRRLDEGLTGVKTELGEIRSVLLNGRGRRDPS